MGLRVPVMGGLPPWRFLPSRDGAAAVPSWAPLRAALRQRHAVELRYHGRRRIICPHALGWRNRRAQVLGYQVGGETSTGTLDPAPRKRWRCRFVDEIERVTTDHAAAGLTPDNYNPARPFSAGVEIALASDRPGHRMSPPAKAQTHGEGPPDLRNLAGSAAIAHWRPPPGETAVEHEYDLGWRPRLPGRLADRDGIA